MRIALVSANREQLPDAVVPLGMLYVMAAVADRHEVRLLDLCFEPDPLHALKTFLDDFQPQLVGIGLRNLQNADYSGCVGNVSYYRSLVETVRKHSEAPVVLGGGGFSILPRQLMLELRPDYGISGEGEQGLARLALALESGERPEVVPGLLYFVEEQLRESASTAGFVELDSLRPPDKSVVDPRYFSISGTDSIQTKRGCPLHCDYCTYPTIEGRTIRQRTPSAVVDEMFATLSLRPEIRHFFIVDSVFNLPPSHAKQVCRELIQRSWTTPWTCYANPIGFDGELAGLMVEAGCSGIEVGSDSGVDAVLDRLRKGFRAERILALHEDCKAAGLRDCHSFILATIGETLDDVHRTLDFCAAMDPFAAIMGIWTDDVEAVDPVLAQERRRLRSQTEELISRRRDEFPRWIVPSIGVNFDARLFRLLRKTGLRGPLWQYLDRMPATAVPARSAGAGARVGGGSSPTGV